MSIFGYFLTEVLDYRHKIRWNILNIIFSNSLLNLEIFFKNRLRRQTLIYCPSVRVLLGHFISIKLRKARALLGQFWTVRKSEKLAYYLATLFSSICERLAHYLANSEQCESPTSSRITWPLYFIQSPKGSRITWPILNSAKVRRGRVLLGHFISFNLRKSGAFVLQFHTITINFNGNEKSAKAIFK